MFYVVALAEPASTVYQLANSNYCHAQQLFRFSNDTYCCCSVLYAALLARGNRLQLSKNNSLLNSDAGYQWLLLLCTAEMVVKVVKCFVLMKMERFAYSSC